MLSKKDVYETLRDHFVCLRLDWEQGNHYQDKFGFILGTGDQLILDPTGQIIPPPKELAPDARGILFGRNGCDATGEILRAIRAHQPENPGAAELRMDWFWWDTKPTRRPGGRYPATPEAIARFARLPLAIVEGPLPNALRDPRFLHQHVRQFIWVRGRGDVPGRVRVERVRDGLPANLSTQLAVLDTIELSPKELGHRLDEAWLTYMKDRPLVAKGYLENQHGRWMRGLTDQLIYEDEEVRRRAREGTLRPPGL